MSTTVIQSERILAAIVAQTAARQRRAGKIMQQMAAISKKSLVARKV